MLTARSQAGSTVPQTTPRSSYISDNGLRVTGRTNQSVDLAWPSCDDLSVDQITSDAAEDNKPSDQDDHVPSSDKRAETNRNKGWYEVQMKKGEHSTNWITIYMGFGEKFRIDDLSPDSVFVFRMKRNKEFVWGSEVVASTDPTPPSAEDLNRAVEMSSTELVTRILKNALPQHLKQILRAHDRNGMTPLMVACFNGSISIAEKLIKSGCGVNETSSGIRRTPLMFACITGRHAVATLLNKHGANWRLRDRCGCNAMDYAINAGSLELVRLAFLHLGPNSVLEMDSSGWTPLMRATIVSDKVEILRYLLHKGANINSVDKRKSKSVLMAAILCKKANFVRFLLQMGANPFYENDHGLNCFQIARGQEYREIVEILNEHKSRMQPPQQQSSLEHVPTPTAIE